MATITLRDGTRLGDFGKPYFVAELNTSHFGNLDTAREMIRSAKEIGCDCVKFQSWSTESLYSRSYYDANPIAKRLVSKFSLADDNLLELANYCKSLDIAFASTPYSRREVDFLVDRCSVPFIKVASMELTNHPFLDYIARTGSAIVLSTGMGDIDEIRRAVDVIAATGNRQVCILHCLSIYPAPPEVIRLNNILGLREAFPGFPIGYSDHSLGLEIPAAAIALGACLIEKHFTLDRSKLGMDNQMATEPGEMAAMIQACRNVHVALGSKERIVPEDELAQRSKMRRSVVASRNIAQGTRLTLADLDAKRPGTGMHPALIPSLIGKIAQRDIPADTLIHETDIAA
jgi:N-acetylneuraminate synthase